MENRFKITQSTIESTTDQDQKRITHNNSEKQRKEKIKSKIENIGHLLPRIRNNEKQSTLAILERAADYITEIQDKNDQLMCDNGVEVQTEEIHSLRQELDNIKSERDRLTDLIKTAGISSLLNSSWKGRKVDSTSNSSDSRPESADTTSNVLQASSKKDKDTESHSKSSKSKRHNTIHSQLESIANKKQITKLAQETIAKMNSGSILMPSLNNFNGMQTTNILPAGLNQQQIFAANPNLLNTSLSNAILASNAQGQVIFSNANSAGSFVNLQGSSTQPSVAFVSPSSNLLANSEKGNGDGSGLLQIAMRDAGITSVSQSFMTPPQLPQITSQAQQAMINSIASSNAETMISADSSQGQQPTPQQTLASVVSNTQCINTGFMNSSFFSGNNCFQQGSNTITNTTQAMNTQVPIMSIGQSNYNQILQNGNALINVPIMNAANQSLPVGGTLSGIGGIQGLQTGQGQIVLVNDHSGLSLMPNYQMVVDPTTLTLTNNSRQFSNDKVAATQKLGHAVDHTKMALTNVMNNTEVINHAATLPVQNQQQGPQQGITLQNTINAQALASNQAQTMQQLAFQPAQQTISLGAANSVIQQAQMNNQLSAQQQQMLSAPYASANTNFLNPNPGLVLPVSQNGNLLTLNTVPSQPNQLPTALILPNGHIIPVVTQPQVLLQQQLQQQQLQQQLLNANCQLQAAVAAQTQTIHPSQIPAKLAVVGNLGNNNIPIIDSNLTTILNPSNVQCQNQSALLQSQQKPPMGLLMTTTISNFPVSNAATTVASINNNMVTTSATQSVMTTQVQASQMHRPTSAPAFVKRSETQTSDSKGVVMSTTTGSLMQFRTSNTSTPDNSILLGNMPQTNLQTAVGTVPSQTDSSITSTLPTNLQSSLPVNQSGQVNGPNGTILITFGPPGQQACCILNSNSMQGLGNVSNQQPTMPAISTIPTTISSTNPTVSSKKNNKKNSQRTIVPKPPKANQTNPLPSVCSMNSSNSVSSTQVSVSSTLWNTAPLSSDQEASSTTMQNVVSTNDICVSTTAESTIIQSPSTSNTSENTGTTDILAKAAESIFSSSLQDISPPISSFYNPANEDNPLHIDTSAGETEDDCSAQSPSKESCDSDHIPTSSRIEMEAETQSTHSLDNACSNLTVSSPSTSTFFKESDICESIGAVSKRGQLKTKIIEPEKEKMKKDFKKLPDSKKLTKKPVSITISEPINFASNQFSSVLEQVESVSIEKKKQKVLNKELVKKSLKVPVKKPAPSVDIPDEIVFMESEISDVLDQVENLRNTWANENDQKKNKKRKGKSNCTELDSDQLIMNKKKKPQIKNQESLIEVEEIKINSSVCENSIIAEENPSELLSPDSTTVTKTVSNYTPSSTDESPSGSNGENTCEKSVNYDPYDITLALEESEPIKSFRAIDSSKTFCQPNSSQVVASYPGKMIEKTQSSPTEIACSTSIHSHNNQVNRLSSRLSPTSTGATSSNCISSNGNSKHNRSRSNSIIDQKSLQLTCNSQPTSNEDNILSKNTYSNRQLTAGPQSVSTMSLTRSQQHSYSRQSQHITQTSLSPVSMPSPISNISAAVEPESNSSVSQNVISNSSAQIASPCTSEQNNYSSPNSLRYSAESLFNTSTKLNTPQPKPHSQPLNQTMIPQDSSSIISNSIAGDAVSVAVTLPSSKSRNMSIYSAENFVHSGRNDNSRVDKNTYSSGSAFSSNNTHHLATSESDALNFANLGLTLTPTVPSNTFTDSSVCNSSTSFTFSLTNSNNTSLFPSHHFPFLHLHSLVTPQLLHGENNENTSSNQQSQTFGLPSFGLNNQKNNNETESNIPHQNTSNEQNIICGSSSSSSTASSHLQPHNTFNFGLSNSLETCSIPRSQPYTDGSNISLNTINLEKSSSNAIIPSNDGARTVSNQKHLPNISQSIPLTSRTQQSSLNSVDCSSQITSSVSTYFSPMNYQSLHTPPLHHPPVTSNETSRANISRSFNANLPTSISNFGSSAPVFNSRFDSNQLLFHSQRDTSAVSQNVNINPEISKSTSFQQQNTVSKAAKQQASQQTLSLSQSQLSQGSLSSHQSTPSSISDNNATLTIPQSNPPPQPSHASQQQQQQQHQQQQHQPQHQQQRSTKQTSRTKQSQSKKNKQSLSEVDSNLSQSIFDQNMALYFPINNTSPPPPRTIQGDTPTFLSSNLFTSSTRQIPNTSSTVLKSSDISTSFNSIFPPSRSQNGIGLNFQTGFGMNTVHNGPTNTPQIPPHSSAMPNLPHVPSLGLGNIFSDVNSTSQNEGLNISPIKFPTNSILPPPQASIDPNSLQHHHQSGALYHNRSHPPPPPVIHNMSINSILNHNPHGFEPRGPVAQAINSTVTPSGFHGPSHSSFPIPPLNFSIHEH